MKSLHIASSSSMYGVCAVCVYSVCVHACPAHHGGGLHAFSVDESAPPPLLTRVLVDFEMRHSVYTCDMAMGW